MAKKLGLGTTTVTKYRPITKFQTVTKTREVVKMRPETRYKRVSLFQYWTE